MAAQSREIRSSVVAVLLRLCQFRDGPNPERQLSADDGYLIHRDGENVLRRPARHGRSYDSITRLALRIGRLWPSEDGHGRRQSRIVKQLVDFDAVVRKASESAFSRYADHRSAERAQGERVVSDVDQRISSPCFAVVSTLADGEKR